MRKTIQVEEEVYNKLLRFKSKSFSDTIGEYLDIHSHLSAKSIKKDISNYEKILIFSYEINEAIEECDNDRFIELLVNFSKTISTDNPLLKTFLSISMPRDLENKEQKTYIIYNKKMDKYKIGRTYKDIRKRITQMSGINSKDTDIIETIDIDIENLLHKHFDKKRFSCEWFDLNKDDIQIIRDLNTIIKQEMENKEHYKVIFERCKIALSVFADSLMIKRLY